MNANEYIRAACRTEKVPMLRTTTVLNFERGAPVPLIEYSVPGITSRDGGGIRRLHSALGMCTEISELKYALMYKDSVNLVEELGDILWYWAIGIDSLPDPWDFVGEKRIASTSPFISFDEAIDKLLHDVCDWADMVRKEVIHEREIPMADLRSTLDRIYYAVQVACRASGTFTLERVMERNIGKLRVRFPEKYDGFRFDERDLEAERKELEKD